MFFSAVPVASNGLVISGILKTRPGRMTYLNLYNNNAAVRYAMLFDSATVPANGATPLVMQQMAATSSVPKELAFPLDGLLFYNGLVIVCSTTAGTLTITGTADMQYTAGIS